MVIRVSPLPCPVSPELGGYVNLGSPLFLSWKPCEAVCTVLGNKAGLALSCEPKRRPWVCRVRMKVLGAGRIACWVPLLSSQPGCKKPCPSFLLKQLSVCHPWDLETSLDPISLGFTSISSCLSGLTRVCCVCVCVHTHDRSLRLAGLALACLWGIELKEVKRRQTHTTAKGQRTLLKGWSSSR